MIPGMDITEFIKWAGVLGVFAIIFAETGLLIGFFLPGDTLLFTAGFLAQAKILPIEIQWLALGVFIAAVLGDSVGYLFGRKVGRKLYDRENSRFFKKTHLEKAEQFYKRYGGVTIVLARFWPTVRTFAPIVAGASKMKYSTFVFFNVVGALIWAVGESCLGYFLGGYLQSKGFKIEQVLLPCLLVIILITWSPAIVHLIRNPDQRRAMWAGFKREMKSLYGIEEKSK
jgi:membrane-associated protein